MSAGTLAVLALCGLVGGVGITSLGPGGVVVTIGLFALSGMSSTAVAGTAIVTHVGCGLLGAGAYLRSGQLRERGTRRVALLLGIGAVLGTPLGVLANEHVSRATFGVLLGCSVTALGLLLGVRERRGATRSASADWRPSSAHLLVIGLGVAVASGMFGLGGPLLSVPLLAAAGVPMLAALAAAQAQSVVVAGVGTIAYAAHGEISWSLALVVGIPELIGVLGGWKLARALPSHHLRYALAGVLVVVGPYLILHNT